MTAVFISGNAHSKNIINDVRNVIIKRLLSNTLRCDFHFMLSNYQKWCNDSNIVENSRFLLNYFIFHTIFTLLYTIILKHKRHELKRGMFACHIISYTLPKVKQHLNDFTSIFCFIIKFDSVFFHISLIYCLSTGKNSGNRRVKCGLYCIWTLREKLQVNWSYEDSFSYIIFMRIWRPFKHRILEIAHPRNYIVWCLGFDSLWIFFIRLQNGLLCFWWDYDG